MAEAIKTCRWCNKEFKELPRRGRQKKFCCERCNRRYFQSERGRPAGYSPVRNRKPKTKPNNKIPQLDIDLQIMAECGIQYGKLQILRRQNLTDAEIKERYSARREKCLNRKGGKK